METPQPSLFPYLPTNTSTSPSLHTMPMETQETEPIFNKDLFVYLIMYTYTFLVGTFDAVGVCVNTSSRHWTDVSLQPWVPGQRVFGVSNRHSHRCNILHDGCEISGHTRENVSMSLFPLSMVIKLHWHQIEVAGLRIVEFPGHMFSLSILIQTDLNENVFKFAIRSTCTTVEAKMLDITSLSTSELGYYNVTMFIVA